MDSGLVQAVSSVVQGVLLLVAAGIAAVQVRQASRARNAATLMQIYQIVHSETCADDRSLMFDSRAPRAAREAASRRVIEMFDWISMLVANGMLPRRYILGMYSGLICRIWEVGSPLIKNARRSAANYAGYLEELARDASAFRQVRFGDTGDVEGAMRRSAAASDPERINRDC